MLLTPDLSRVAPPNFITYIPIGLAGEREYVPMTTELCLSIDSIVSAAREQVSSELAGEVVILNLRAGVYHGLESTGARVWQLIQKPRTVCDVRDVLLSEYDVEAGTCERDLLELLEELANHGLLEVHAQPVA
jgi:hypothetical protein